MNRIILVGNGFDLAHNLPTSYKDFMDWYLEQRVKGLKSIDEDLSKDVLCTIKALYGKKLSSIYENHTMRSQKCQKVFADIYGGHCFEDLVVENPSQLFECIYKSYQDKQWLDIENDYYSILCSIADNKMLDESKKATQVEKLNKELDFIKDKLTEYLGDVMKKHDTYDDKFQEQILERIRPIDIAISSRIEINTMIDKRLEPGRMQWGKFLKKYGKPDNLSRRLRDIIRYNNTTEIKRKGLQSIQDEQVRNALTLPDRIMLVNFNYTKTADCYMPNEDIFSIFHIHGLLEEPDKVIFGYGDDHDKTYQEILRKNDNRYLQHIKSFHYHEAMNYRKILEFVDYEPYQIYIMGLSCGISDRTLLNTLFEHKNCVSIKPFYYKKDDGTDDYLNIVQNIARNFTDMKLMRDRVVNKTLCIPLANVDSETKTM